MSRMSELMLLENPARRRRRHSSRNPIAKSLGGVIPYTQGTDIMEMAAAVGGLAICGLVPAMVIKPAAGKKVLTDTQKWLKIGVAFLLAIGAGMVGKSIKVGKAALIGGIAGTGAIAYSELTSKDLIKSSADVIRMPSLPSPSVIARSYQTDFEDIKAI